MSRGISGTAVTVTVGGFVLLYSAIKNATISSTLRSFLAGQPVASVTSNGGVSASGGPGNDKAHSSFGSGPPKGGQSGSQYNFLVMQLRAVGFNNAAAAAILGNIQVESGFSPTAYNAGEGAIGFCQWEHGRRLALQAYARAHGSTETDPAMQFGYMMRELNTAFVHVYLQLKALPNTSGGASYGAAVWDAQYEISSGEARETRKSNAVAIFNTL